MRASCVLLTAALAAACPPGPGPLRADEIAPGEPFDLRMGEAKQMPSEGLTVRFTSLVGDSRCPKDVTCIWEGDAEIELLLTRGEDEAALRLHTNGGARYPRQAAALGCSLRLEALEPYPVSTRRTPPEDYVATLVLTLAEPAE